MIFKQLIRSKLVRLSFLAVPLLLVAIGLVYSTLMPQTQVARYDWQLPKGLPAPFVPADNPMSEAKVELGRFLFYDKNLSANGTFSCSSCHDQSKAFSDGKALAVGSTGQVHARNSQGLANVAYNASLTWANPSLTNLEKQILVPMFGEFPKELGITGHEEEVLARFQSDKRYQTMFKAALPDNAQVNWDNIAKALASFSRSLVSFDSAYDHYVYQADQQALSPAAQRGMRLFFSEELECHHCHTGFNFSDSTRHVNSTAAFQSLPFHNTGLYNTDGKGGYPLGNTGVHEVTGKPNDMGRFRAPTLRNIAFTAPYMHDGSIATLTDVIRFYANGGRQISEGENAGDGRLNPLKSGFIAGFKLCDQEVADLVAFLESLSDNQFITNPRFSDPFAQPASK